MPTSDSKPIKLILTDIDGTILPFGESVLSQYALDSFHAALDAGIHIGPATGRAANRVAPIFSDDSACYQTMLATNGMEVLLDGELICEKRIDLEPLGNTVDVLRQLEGVGICYFDGPTAYILHGSKEDLTEAFPAYGRTARIAAGLPDEPPVKVNIFVRGDFARTQEVLELLQSEVSGIGFNLPMEGFLNVTPPNWSKASGIDLLCEHLGIGLDQVCVFGDSDNDLEMLAHVPLSAAVENATKNAKTAAHHLIGSVDEGAVPRLIERIAQGEKPF
ncbi:MAG: HAD family phosphatase [Atopobiaceae bacterium]|nr:HAD family phosphatase [Atopobiaceae bacterium]